MTFNANQWYTARDLARAGIRNDQALQLLVARGVVEAQCDGYSESYLGKSLLLAIDAGKLGVGEPIELSSGKRAATRPNASVARLSPTRPAVSTRQQPAARATAASPNATVQPKPQPSLQSRYDVMAVAWHELVDDQLASCGGDRVRAAIQANRSMPGLAQRVDALHNQLREEAAAAIKPKPKLPGTASERSAAWVASGKRGVCRLA